MLEQPLFGEKIILKDNNLRVPDNPVIPFIEGDGIGPDIWSAAKRVLDTAVNNAYNGAKKISWFEIYAGEKSFEKYNEWLPKDTLTAMKEYLIGIKGPLTTPIGGGFRSLNVALRQELDLYACVRPIRYFKGVPSPVKHPEWIDMTIFRENSEDIYAGIEWQEGSEEAIKIINYLQDNMGVSRIRFPKTSGIGIKPVSKEGTYRLVRAAIQYAVNNEEKSVTLVHKGNIMKFTEGAFKNWGYELAEKEFGDKVFTWAQYDSIKKEHGKEIADKIQDKAINDGKVIIKDIIADAFLQQILTRPKEYNVIATMNLNGDYISDALAAQVGGIGIAPGANINYDTGIALFEATHGTAPKYAGMDKVNPSSLILSGEMMLRFIGWDKAADLIIQAMEKTILRKEVTYDFARLMEAATELKCSEFANALIQNMN